MIADKVVVVAPLNWGLGHATRCVPIIDHLLQQNVNVHIYSDGAALSFLRDYYPNLIFHEARELKVRYPSGKFMIRTRMFLSSILQFRKFKKHIKSDNSRIQELMLQVAPDLIISDNRYGVFHSNYPSVIISHQLDIRIPIIKKAIQKWLVKKLSNFDSVWVPDSADRQGLSGSLGHPVKPVHKSVVYLGPLSRFQKSNANGSFITAIISGPGQQKFDFANQIIKEFSRYSKQNPQQQFIIVIGSNNQIIGAEQGNIQIRYLPNSQDLEKILHNSTIVISRSGYSTIMDLNQLEIPGIFTPTPGQFEQEYLAKYLCKEHGFLTCFDINNKLDVFLDRVKAENIKPVQQKTYIQEILDNWLK